jgi:ATPase family associated with various cellular activities (AAA)
MNGSSPGKVHSISVAVNVGGGAACSLPQAKSTPSERPKSLYMGRSFDRTARWLRRISQPRAQPADAPAHKQLRCAAVELEERKTWTLARLAGLVTVGRIQGWIPEDRALPTTDAVRTDAVRTDAVRTRPTGDPITPMQRLARQLELSDPALDVLWLLACIEIEPSVARAAQLLVSPGMHELSAQMVERLVDADGDVLDRLSRLELIELVAERRVPHHRRPLRANDRVIDLVRGRVDLDRELEPLAELIEVSPRDPFDLRVPGELERAIAVGANVLAVACGIEGSGRATLLRHACTTAGRPVLEVRCSELSTDHALLRRQLRALARECRLHEALPLLRELGVADDRSSIVERELLRACEGPVLATARESCTWATSRPLLSLVVALPNEAARATMWRDALPEADPEVVAVCAGRYTIAPGMLARAADAVRAAADHTSPVTADDVRLALRVQLERRLANCARRIETRQTWNDLVLPVDQLDILIELIARVRHRRQVLETWGFGDKIGRGLGLSVLFSGPPGTGKTMIGGLVAGELGLDLYQVDLSKVVSKYIGETEKQLAAVFEAAESGHAILLFDEADSLFGKRTDVKSSNDRYANLEVNYLLQRIEAFSGICLLTTNHENAIDAAFLRRLALHVRIPLPDRDERELLWKAMMPERAERSADFDVSRLANEFVMSGGYIKNAVLRAAYFAADEQVPIAMTHLWRGARAEYEAMGKVAYQVA